jgi:hypothetical protein
MTAVGNAQTITGTRKFGTASMFFDGTGDAVTATDSATLEIGARDFTIEGWLWFDALPTAGNQSWFYGKYSSGVDQRSVSFYINNSAGTYSLNCLLNPTGLSAANVVTSVNFASAPPVFTFLHLAVTRKSGTVRFFVNGVQLGADQTNNTTAFDGTSDISIGGTHVGANDLTGYIDDFRLTIGAARYIANFTPPTEELPEIGTVWVDNFNGTNGSATFNTADQMPQTYSAVGGNAQYSTAAGNPKFGTAALLLDGNGDYLTLPVTEHFNFGTGDFTVEFHLRRKGDSAIYGASSLIIDGRTNSITSGRMSMGMGGPEGTVTGGVTIPANTLYMYVPNGTAPALVAPSPMVLNQYYHIAFQKKASVLTLFIDGVEVGSVADTNSWSLSGSQLGARYAISGSNWSGFNGNFDALRITKGYARYS